MLNIIRESKERLELLINHNNVKLEDPNEVIRNLVREHEELKIQLRRKDECVERIEKSRAEKAEKVENLKGNLKKRLKLWQILRNVILQIFPALA